LLRGEFIGVIDLHVHAGPDVRPRKMDAVTLARTAKDKAPRSCRGQISKHL